MKDVARRILTLFDELQRESLDLHVLFEMAGGPAPAQREEVLDAVAELVGIGLLHTAEGGDFYLRSEKGFLAIAGPRDVTLYTRQGCQLCEEAKTAMAPALKTFGARLREVDIDSDPVLQREYTSDVPVILIASKEFARHRVDAAEFRRSLKAAAD